MRLTYGAASGSGLAALSGGARHDLARAAGACAPEVRFHGLARGPVGVEAWLRAMAGLLAAFPDASLDVEDVFAEGERVAVRQTFRGTHRGPFRGMVATGRSVQLPVILLYRVDGARIVEGWLSADCLSLLEQLDHGRSAGVGTRRS